MRSNKHNGQRLTTVKPATPIRYEEVAQVAYELFQQRGGDHGHDQEDWFRAEQIVRTHRQRRIR